MTQIHIPVDFSRLAVTLIVSTMCHVFIITSLLCSQTPNGFLFISKSLLLFNVSALNLIKPRTQSLHVSHHFSSCAKKPAVNEPLQPVLEAFRGTIRSSLSMELNMCQK